MKVILVKDCKDGKVNDVIDVSAGYATNFLIKKQLAIPFNNKTKHMLSNKLNNLQIEEEKRIKNALIAKEAIEKKQLSFELKVTNMVVHGSITKKQILKQLSDEGIKVGPHSIESIKISSLGFTKVKVTIYKNIIAELKVEVKDGK